MGSPARILVFSGSTRTGSYNRKLAENAARMLKEAGAEVTRLNLADYPIPLYDGDLEKAHGLPENAAKLQHMFTEHDGFFIACPEYNGLITPLLKNTIDWLTRPGAEGTAPLRDKAAGLGAASPGALGGIRGLVTVRMLLNNLLVHVVPHQVAVSRAADAFDDNDLLVDEMPRKLLGNTVEALVRAAESLGTART